MKLEEVLELLSEGLEEAEEFACDELYCETQRFAGAYGLLRGKITYILRKHGIELKEEDECFGFE